jgi:hypothetical protein
VSLSDRLFASPLVTLAQRALGGGGDAWIAGGAVRDAALGHEVTDLDLAVAGDPEQAARAIAREGGGHAFELSAEFATWRAVAVNHSWQVDATALRGGSIEEDLAARDFTLGAVAVPLEGGDPVDPSNWRSTRGRGRWRGRKRGGPPRPPVSASSPSCAGSSAGRTRCAASRCSTNWT